MNIQVTFNPKEMLRNIDRKDILDYVKATITDEERESIGNSIYTTDSDTLWEALELRAEQERKDLSTFVSSRLKSYELLNNIELDEVLDYIKDNSQYFIAENVEELIEQIRVSGCIDEVAELFEVKYIG